MESSERPDDILPLYRPDILPLRGPEEPGAGDVPASYSTDARINHLRRVPLFADFAEADLLRIADISRIVETRAGAILTEAGKPGDSFFVIIDGRVSVETQVGPMDPLHPGDFFGEMSLLDGEPRSATVTATTDVRLLIVDRSQFWRLLNDAPDLLRRILVVLSRRVRRLEQAAHALEHRMKQI